MMQKILLDTDIGSDIDDSLCLSYLLHQPECELLGITTVGGHSTDRAMVADSICRLAGRTIPIYPGQEQPFLIPQKQDICQQSEWLKSYPHKESFPKHEAIQFLKDTIERYPNEVTLLAIGPMTNLALLFTMYPQTAGKLKSLVMMCGQFTENEKNAPCCEWNCLCDPIASAIVYAAPLLKHFSIGLDVTNSVTLTQKEVRTMLVAPECLPILDYFDMWIQQRGEMTFHDPIAAAYIFDEQLLTFSKGDVSVEIADNKLAGLTRFVPSQYGKHFVAAEINTDRFFKHFSQTLLN